MTVLYESPARVNHFACSAADLAHVRALPSVSSSGKTIAENTLRQAVRTAVRLAVPLLERTLIALKDRTDRTNDLFRRVFLVQAGATAPSTKNTWAHLVSRRLEAVRRTLSGGSIFYRCHCAPDVCDDWSTYIACTLSKPKRTICLGPTFWNRWALNRNVSNAMTLIHEVLHVYFWENLGHHRRRPVSSVYCYLAFIAWLHGLGEGTIRFYVDRCKRFEGD